MCCIPLSTKELQTASSIITLQNTQPVERILSIRLVMSTTMDLVFAPVFEGATSLPLHGKKVDGVIYAITNTADSVLAQGVYYIPLFSRASVDNSAV